uniref:Uncharacterized protein n=1 Tax=Glossina palpalis gambiensis TaxID=67801 RepID=A0A1B0BAF6_9MUSC
MNKRKSTVNTYPAAVVIINLQRAPLYSLLKLLLKGKLYIIFDVPLLSTGYITKLLFALLSAGNENTNFQFYTTAPVNDVSSDDKWAQYAGQKNHSFSDKA